MSAAAPAWSGAGTLISAVGGHTGLTGTVIAGSDRAVQDGSNQLSTGTLASRDIENRSDYDAPGFSFGGGFSSKPTGQKACGGSVGDDAGFEITRAFQNEAST